MTALLGPAVAIVGGALFLAAYAGGVWLLLAILDRLDRLGGTHR